MKRFFYSHPLFSNILMATDILLPCVLGVILSFWLDYAKIENPHWLIILFAGILFSVLLALPFVSSPTLKCLDETLDELWQLKRTRKVFHAPQQHVTIDHAKAYIEQNLKKRKLKKSDCTLYHSETVVCAGIWMKDITFYYKYSGSEIHPT